MHRTGPAPALTATTASGLETIVVRSAGELERVEPSWRTFVTDQQAADFDHFSMMLRARRTILRPHVVLLQRGGEPVALAVGRIEETRLPARIGYRTVFSPRVRSLTIPPDGVLGDPSESDLILLFDELRAAVDGGEADVLTFRFLRPESALHGVATTRPAGLFRQQADRGRMWDLPLPETYDAFLQALGSRTRGKLRYYENRLRKAFAEVEVRVYQEPSDLEAIFRDVVPVSRETYQWRLGRGFVDNDETRARVSFLLANGSYRCYVLAVDGTPVAFWNGEGFGGRFRTGIPGFDPRYGEHRVGTFLLLRLIEDLCADPAVSVCDFGFGDAEYKERFATRSFEVESVTVYGRRPRPVAINVARRSIGFAATIAEGAARRLGLVRRLKTGWRRRLR